MMVRENRQESDHQKERTRASEGEDKSIRRRGQEQIHPGKRLEMSRAALRICKDGKFPEIQSDQEPSCWSRDQARNPASKWRENASIY